MTTRKYMQAELQPPRRGRKTQVWHILGGGEHLLGTVHWYAHWRRYVFSPEPSALFDGACLTDLAVFCEEATARRRRERLHAPAGEL